MIVVNEIHWETIGIMTAIIMLGGFIYNLIHARESISNGKFKLLVMIKENYPRFLYSLVCSFTISFTLNWIPESSKFITSLTGTELTYSSVGLLIFGAAFAKLLFNKTTKVKSDNGKV